jgi:hypothetical protein
VEVKGTRRRMGIPSVDAGEERGDSTPPSRHMGVQSTTLCTCTPQAGLPRRIKGGGACEPLAAREARNTRDLVRGAMCGHPQTGSAKAVG